MADAPETAVVLAEYEDPKEGRRAVSFAVRMETMCAQIAGVAQFLPPATWTARPGEDVTGHQR